MVSLEKELEKEQTGIQFPQEHKKIKELFLKNL